MSKSNGSIHRNVLVASTQDTVELALAVELRFLELFHTHRRIQGTQLEVPLELNAAMLRWRELRVRHKAGDRRNTADELSSTRMIAQWTVDVNRLLHNQKPIKVIWSE